jgi:K+-sensing histidine kinase KdpD
MKGNESAPARVAAGILPIAVGGLLVAVRGVLDSADLVLILVLVVVAIAMSGDRVAAGIAAIVAAVSFDFFLTQPYGSLRITSASDITTTLILLIIGLAVGQIAIAGGERRREAIRAQQELERLEYVAARIAADASILPLIGLVETKIAETLSLASCRFGLQRPELPELFPDGRVDTSTHVMADGAFALPAEGVALAVVGAGETVGWLRLTPGRPVGVTVDTRKVAVALSQQLGAALARPAIDTFAE